MEFLSASHLRENAIVDVATAIRETSDLPIEDQLDLVEKLWDRIVGAGWQPEVDADLRALLDERAKELDVNPGRAVTWGQLVRALSESVTPSERGT